MLDLPIALWRWREEGLVQLVQTQIKSRTLYRLPRKLLQDSEGHEITMKAPNDIEHHR